MKLHELIINTIAFILLMLAVVISGDYKDGFWFFGIYTILFNVLSYIVSAHNKFEIENKKLKEDKARLIGRLRETTKYLGTSVGLIIGTLKYKNEELLTELDTENKQK